MSLGEPTWRKWMGHRKLRAGEGTSNTRGTEQAWEGAPADPQAAGPSQLPGHRPHSPRGTHRPRASPWPAAWPRYAGSAVGLELSAPGSSVGGPCWGALCSPRHGSSRSRGDLSSDRVR